MQATDHVSEVGEERNALWLLQPWWCFFSVYPRDETENHHWPIAQCRCYPYMQHFCRW